MDRIEKAKDLIEKAKKSGLHLEFDSGLVIMKQQSTDKSENCSLMATEIVKYLPEVRSALQKRTAVTRARKLLGQRVFSSEFGEGVLTGAGADDNGWLAISIAKSASRSTEHQILAEELLVILIEGGEAKNVFDIESRAEKQRMGLSSGGREK